MMMYFRQALRKRLNLSEVQAFYVKQAWNTMMGLMAIVLLIYLGKRAGVFSGLEGNLFTTLPVYAILPTFFLSESILGLIPPDLFIAWFSGQEQFLVYFVLLAVLSYAGGIISYLTGQKLKQQEVLPGKLEKLLRKPQNLFRKWGGGIVILAALTPLPFSPVSLVAGLFGFSFKKYAGYALFRIPRILIYGFAIQYFLI